jgi:hypothetical protein
MQDSYIEIQHQVQFLINYAQTFKRTPRTDVKNVVL